MAGYVMAATDADGNRRMERVMSTAPTLGEAAEFGDSYQMRYVSVRHDHDITLYGREADGTWSLLVADAPAPVVVEIRRHHGLATGSAAPAAAAPQRRSGPRPRRPAPTRTAPQAPPAAAAPAAREATPAPVPPQDAMPRAQAARPDPHPVLDTKVNWSRLYADPQVITYGKKSMALDQVEWISYCATQTAEKRFMYPTTYWNTWNFHVGRYPYYGGPQLKVDFAKGGRRAEQPEEWAFLVNLARRYLEPRLRAELVAGVRRGETVTVGGSVKVSRSGIACAKPRVSLPWQSFSGTRVHNGMVCVYQAGVDKPVLTVPLTHPNAGMMPDVLAALAP